jgi:hypothetical protein
MSTELASRDQSLSAYAADLEAICTEIEMCDGEIPQDTMARFEFANLALQAKCERWIGYRDAIDGMITALEAKAKRSQAAVRGAKALKTYLDNGMKFVIESNPNLTFKGESGTLYLHGQAPAVRYAFKFEDKTVYRTVEPIVAQMEPSVVPYLKDVTYQVIDSEKLKADLKAGITLNWASLEAGKHVRIKGS